MTNENESQQMLAGLELAAAYGAKTGALRLAVVATIQALHDEKLLEPRHAAMCQLALEMADAVTAGARGGRASAAAMAAAQLRETLEALPEPSSAGVQEKFEKWVEDMAKEDATS